jgi:hypothetical protein
MQLDAMGLDNVQAKVFQPAKAAAPLMSEATVFYLRLKGDGKGHRRSLVPPSVMLML